MIIFAILISLPAMALVLVALVGSDAFAGKNAYQCTVTNQYELEDSGALSDWDTGMHLGETFAVDRITGVVVGESFNTNLATTIQVLQLALKPGNAWRAFYHVTGPYGTYSALLTVFEFKDQAKKPFIWAGSLWISTGLCD